MLPGKIFYFIALASCAAALLSRAFRVDRVLGWIVVLSLAANLSGAALMGWWVQRMHGRPYTAGDEVGYQMEGERLLRSWRGGPAFVRATVGIYAPINAVVIAIAGPGQTQMRVLTAIVGVAGVGAVYWLAMLLFASVPPARLAALLSATSPLLILYSWANLRDRWIGVAAVVVLIATVRLIERWSWERLFVLSCAVLFLAELRHYWGALLGWFAVIGYLAFSRGAWRPRLLHTVAVAAAVGTMLAYVTGAFLATSMRGENARRYVTL